MTLTPAYLFLQHWPFFLSLGKQSWVPSAQPVLPVRLSRKAESSRAGSAKSGRRNAIERVHVLCASRCGLRQLSTQKIRQKQRANILLFPYTYSAQGCLPAKHTSTYSQTEAVNKGPVCAVSMVRRAAAAHYRRPQSVRWMPSINRDIHRRSSREAFRNQISLKSSFCGSHVQAII